MKTKILKIKGDWTEVLNDCRSTVGKKFSTKEPSEQFRLGILIAEHSPIRDIIIKFLWEEIPSWVATHFCRHKWECYIKTQRSDRTGTDRNKLPQDTPVTFTGEANSQHLIDTMRKRLCFQASPETRSYAEDLKKAIAVDNPEIALVLVPNCVYRGGCPEMQCCGEWKRFCDWYDNNDENDNYIGELSIIDRYRAYDAYLKEVRNG